MNIQSIRGATTCLNNTVEAIEEAVNELVAELVNRNRLQPSQIISVIFSVTTDLNACFPASIARKQTGWETVSLIDCQQMFVKNDLPKCIRILVHVRLSENQVPNHTYLGKASILRPDRSIKALP
ncbi:MULTISPECIES: chorismate mutase [unclassified Prochlorococcus]|uniref:chorismate mutase n=1 Tax=unclassified Prochlorococcus TaxID=2627481 RepID=UPI00053379E6|nr:MULTISPECIES: chorismate mutase [unclassified Prochlorococcus]KGG16373.1 Chorismate mutase II [Prochlorococcus sp. MIT 0603]KGG17893.1 Chorismate mutase II [Prochlorococcus sp. MIT 0602]